MAGYIQDISGKRFGRLIVDSYAYSKRKNSFWLCKCDCGNTVVVSKGRLTTGVTKSCGCFAREIRSKRLRKHQMWKSRLYNVWSGMKQRCYNKKNPSYKYYGGKGVVLCDEWKNNFLSFYNWAMKNGYDNEAARGVCTIDRINVYGNYEPKNCQFITIQEQQKNRRETKK